VFDRNRVAVSAVVFSLATGCIGAGITYPTTHTSAVRGLLGGEPDTPPWTPRCHEPPSGRAPAIERCSEGTKWAFVTLLIGIPLPIPYWRFRTFEDFEIREGVLTKTERSLGSTGAFCGFWFVFIPTERDPVWRFTCDAQ
jgi:hypothetical protein